MFRLWRKTIFPRWHANRQNQFDGLKQYPSCSKILVVYTGSQKKNYSNQNDEKKRHANKQDKQCWNDPQFLFSSFHISLLETAGWVGTAAALCLNYHVKYMKHIFEYDRVNSNCLFYNIALAMPKCTVQEKTFVPNVPQSTLSVSSKVHQPTKDKFSDSTHILEVIRNLTKQYTVTTENSAGIMNINKNDKKAFRHFQTAARLGSSQAFYNLGLCYELGKGTKINFNRAAFCYKKAAMKGHGLASFNLAIYFLKGIGGLPVDVEVAKMLLVKAAKQGVPEAQVYLGIEYLEQKRWLDAVKIFINLAEKDIPDGQYYLGLCYENGWGVQRNEKMAVSLYEKSAVKGHKKATFKLGNYYEVGRGGCVKDSDFASALYLVLADQSFKDSKRAYSLLSANETDLSAKATQRSVIHQKCEKHNLHISASVPELSVTVKETIYHTLKITAASYLNLIIPFFSVKNNGFMQKPNFSIGEEKIIIEHPKNVNDISHVMQVPT